MNGSFSRVNVLNSFRSDMRLAVYKCSAMLTRTAFTNLFSGRAIFGVVHLRALPGAPLFTSMDDVLELALHDARALRDGGCDGLVIENFGDRPFTRARVEAETVAAMTRVITEIRRDVALPFGVNILRNDALS